MAESTADIGVPLGASFAAGESVEPAAGGDAGRAADLALARRAASGDLEAFEEVYRRHARRVFGLCLRMTRDASEAEDLTQDVFVHLFRKIANFRGDSALSTWIHRVAVNQVLMHFRKRRSRPESVTADGETPEEAGPGGAGRGRTGVIDLVALDQAVARLPEGYRAVFVLYDVEGYDHAEIARMLGISPGTSKSQLHKARRRLRDLIRGAPPPGRAG